MVIKKVMEHAKLAKSCGILLSVMTFTNLAPELYKSYMFFATNKNPYRKSAFSDVFCKMSRNRGHGKLRNSHGKVMEKYVVKSVRTLNMYIKGRLD